jgi:hypothetical protein
MSFHPDDDRHSALLHAIHEAATLIAKEFRHMADAEAQALADLSTAVTNLSTAVTAEIAALTAALAATVPPLDHSPAIEAAVTNLNSLATALKASIPPAPTPTPVPAPPAPAS